MLSASVPAEEYLSTFVCNFNFSFSIGCGYGQTIIKSPAIAKP
jgi:hypothetical protein